MPRGPGVKLAVQQNLTFTMMAFVRLKRNSCVERSGLKKKICAKVILLKTNKDCLLPVCIPAFELASCVNMSKNQCDAISNWNLYLPRKKWNQNLCDEVFCWSSGRRQRFMYRPSGSGAKKAICANWRQDWSKQTNCQTKSPRSDDARMKLWQKIFTWEILMSHCLGVAAVQDRARVAQEFEASKSMWYPVLVPHITW